MANKIYVAPESAIVWKSSGGTYTFTPTSVANAAGRIGAQGDLGSASHSGWYRWRAKTKCGTAGTVGRAVRIYIATSDGTIEDGNLSTADAGVSSEDKTRNLLFVGCIVVDKASDATEPFQASGIVYLPYRYVSPVWWNDTAQALSSTAGDHEFQLIPIPDEIQ